jgi:hypothetical protein
VYHSYADIRLALDHVSRSGIPYFLTTTFSQCQANEDIKSLGLWRTTDLTARAIG